MKTQDRLYFESFRAVVKAINSTLDRQEVLDVLVRNVALVMDLKACAIRLLHGKKRTLELLASYGLKFVRLGKMERYTHAIAGATILLSGIGILFLGL